MAYLGLETQKPIKPLKKKSTYIFPKTTADQVITDESTDKRLPETLGEFSTFRDCSNVPFNEIAAGKGAFLVNWSSANAADGNVMLGISDGWSALAMSYSGVIYNTAIDKTSWEAVSISKGGGTFDGEVYSYNMTQHPARGCFRNIEVWQGGQIISTGLIHMERK